MKKLTLALGLILFGHQALAEGVIYSNNINPSGAALVYDQNPGIVAAGNRVVFAGTERFLTTALIQIYNAGADVSSAVTLSLYNVSGTTLGTLIGSYSLAPVNYVGAVVSTLTFSLPYVNVPNEIVWAVGFSPQTDLGLVYYDPETVGFTPDDEAWWDTGSGLQYTFLPGGARNTVPSSLRNPKPPNRHPGSCSELPS